MGPINRRLLSLINDHQNPTSVNIPIGALNLPDPVHPASIPYVPPPPAHTTCACGNEATLCVICAMRTSSISTRSLTIKKRGRQICGCCGHYWKALGPSYHKLTSRGERQCHVKETGPEPIQRVRCKDLNCTKLKTMKKSNAFNLIGHFHPCTCDLCK